MWHSCVYLCAAWRGSTGFLVRRRVSIQGHGPYVSILRMADVRMTIAVARVLREFLADVGEPRYGYELMQSTEFPSGKLYPILARLQHAGWLCREREALIRPMSVAPLATCTG